VNLVGKTVICIRPEPLTGRNFVKTNDDNRLKMTIKRVLYIIVLFFGLIVTVKAQGVAIFPKGEKAANVHHVGNVWLNELSPADSTFAYSTAQAVFNPGARLDWHQHPGGQILLITDGVGFYQEKGKPKHTIRKGDIVKCPPGVPHWHGATPETGVTYVATSPTQKGKTVWLQRVTDQEYGSK
jgi:quercetin dioxygenase-like cupin family protein